MNNLNLEVDAKDILTILHSEFHQRKTFVFRCLTSYAAFCGLSMGWVSTINDIGGIAKAFLIILVMFFAIIGFLKGRGVAHSQSMTAKSIVKINKSLGLFDYYYPAEWQNWGSKKESWFIWGFAGIGIITSLTILLVDSNLIEFLAYFIVAQ